MVQSYLPVMGPVIADNFLSETDCKYLRWPLLITSRFVQVVWWDTIYLGAVGVILKLSAITLRQIGEDLQITVTTLQMQTDHHGLQSVWVGLHRWVQLVYDTSLCSRGLKCESDTFELLVSLSSCPHLWPQALGGDRVRLQAVEMSFLWRVRSSVIWERLGVEQLLFHMLV